MRNESKRYSGFAQQPACSHNHKEKSGCARPKPGATAGGCSFDGAQIALLPIADVAHIVHGPIACAGASWDNQGTRSSGPTLYRIGMTTDLSETDVVMGRGEKRCCTPFVRRWKLPPGGGVCLRHLRHRADWRRYGSRLQAATDFLGRAGDSGGRRRLYGTKTWATAWPVKQCSSM